ncbi:MAG TPA: ABATE domain-containing protein [Pseudonocardiaceae bacterium]|jgi:predicted RNA-binding Zn ribbon-like protein
MVDSWRMPWLRCDTGAAWLDLLATQSGAYGPTPRERLVDADTLTWWLDVEGLLPQTAPTEADLPATRTLRDALRAIALAVIHDQPIPADHAATLNNHLAADRPLTWPPRAPASTAEALGRVARAAVDTLTGDRRADLHQCADTECGLLFLDAGGRRRWCAADVCGVRNRVRSHRERTRAHQQ